MTPSQTSADRPSSGAQAPVLRLGAVTVTGLWDGYFDVPAPFLTAADNMPVPSQDPVHIDINAFLIQTPGRTLLVDTGCGAKLGPTVNRLIGSLRAAGVEPEAIDGVLCTHIHPDHTNGLIDAEGRANFPNAQVFVHRQEMDFWLSQEQADRAPEALRYQFAWAREAFAPYAGRIEPFEKGQIIDGIEAVPLYGHTPGHSGFHIDGGGRRQLLIWGDSVHAIEVQAHDPDIAVVADVDQDAARRTRRRLFDQVASDDLLVTGMHLPFPGFGRMVRSGQAFEYTPQSPT